MDLNGVAVSYGGKILRPLEGEVLVVDKPLGWSSFHVVKRLRGALSSRLKKAGIKENQSGTCRHA